MSARAEAVQLYRAMLQSSRRFSNYNFREYFLRRTREDFAAAKSETNPAKVAELLAKGRTELEVIRRQATISSMYDMGGRKHVLEMPRTSA
ncbi:hypothetical protein T484DRAFT_1793255 [Baffinella frigidus]|nr:hypothetical protein T484DRAFT_1793255 [Cryptophyta sp. CCMP2293]